MSVDALSTVKVSRPGRENPGSELPMFLILVTLKVCLRSSPKTLFLTAALIVTSCR